MQKHIAVLFSLILRLTMVAIYLFYATSYVSYVWIWFSDGLVEKVVGGAMTEVTDRPFCNLNGRSVWWLAIGEGVTLDYEQLWN